MAGESRPVGPMLERFAAFHHMAADELAGFLGVDVDKLEALRAEELLDERAPEFQAQTQRLAARSGMSAARLMQVARIAKLLR